MSKTSFFFVSDFCLCFCTLTKIYCLSLDSGSAYMQAVITYAKQQYLSPPHKYILLPHTNTFHGHRQIFNSCTQTALSAAKKLKFMFEAECILYKVGVPILIWTTRCNAKIQVGLIQRFCPGWQNATFWAFLWRVLCACLLLFTLRCTRCELGSSLEVSTLWIVAKVHFWWYLWSTWSNFARRVISWDQY